MALGVGPGDEVVTTALSFFATVEAILRLGATPRFADVDPATLNLTPEAVRPLLTDRTRAVLVVHLFGRAADVVGLTALCQDHDVPLVEDAAQAFGVRAAGRALGTFGALGCYSFFPAKPLGALGDGGLVVSRDADLAERVRALRVHGATARNVHTEVGGNFRLDALQAAALGAKLPGFDQRLASRRAVVRAYDAALDGIDGIERLRPEAGDATPAAVYTVRARHGRRDALREALGAAGIDTAIYYPCPLSQQPVVRRVVPRPDPTPEATRAAAEVISLPLYYGMPEASVRRVVEALVKALSRIGD
jgi:dTDP-4-amino-4,6-dideoxygalactose transaminase